MDVPDEKTAIIAAVRHWRNLPEIVSFVVERHGFGNSDEGFGVTYPGDLDEYDREVDGRIIPLGFVELYGFWGPPDGYELMVTESRFLSVLAELLDNEGHRVEATRVRSLMA